MKRYNCTLLEYQDVNGIDPKQMKARFEMDKDEKHGRLKALIFKIIYPVIKSLPADKAVFEIECGEEQLIEMGILLMCGKLYSFSEKGVEG